MSDENTKIKNKADYYSVFGFMITDLGLSGSELIVYAIIYKFSSDGVNKFFGSQKYLADWAGINERHVRRVLDSLLNKGLIIKSEEYKNNVKFVQYQAVFPDSVVGKDVQGNCDVLEMSVEGTKCPGGGDKMSDNKREYITTNISPRETYSYPTSVSKEINVTKKDTHRSLSGSSHENPVGNAITDCSPQQAEEAKDFDIFWIAYPKHCGKTEARKAFHKHVRHEDMKELLDGVDKYRRTKQWSESKYIPYPSTFLNQERWKDGVEPDYKNWDEMSEAERGLMEEVLKGVDPNDLR